MRHNTLKIIIGILCIVLVGIVIYSDDITQYKNKLSTSQIKIVTTNTNNNIKVLDNDGIYINPDYRYSFLRMSKTIKYYRYYPDECKMTLSNDWVVVSKSHSCTSDDFDIVLYQKNIEDNI